MGFQKLVFTKTSKTYSIKALFCFLISFNISNAQTTYIFSDDTLKINQYLEGTSGNASKYNRPYFDFKLNLPDGTYIKLNVAKKDSAKVDLSKHIYAKGQYVNSKREGTFEYYYEYNKKKKNCSARVVQINNYKEGKLDGYYYHSNSTYKLEEGYYKDGKEHGFFTWYDPSTGLLKQIRFYEDGVLKYRVKYHNGKMYPFETDPKIENEYIDYNTPPKK